MNTDTSPPFTFSHFLSLSISYLSLPFLCLARPALHQGKYVTRQHLASAVNAVTGGLSAVSKTVESLRSQVKDGLGDLTQRVEYGLGVQEEIM